MNYRYSKSIRLYMTIIPNASAAHPFDTNGDEDSRVEGNIHIRIQQRNGRKTITTVEGIPKEYDLKMILKAFKKDFACNGTLVTDPKMGEVMQLNGDHRDKVYDFLIAESIAKAENVKIHGF